MEEPCKCITASNSIYVISSATCDVALIARNITYLCAACSGECEPAWHTNQIAYSIYGWKMDGQALFQTRILLLNHICK